MLVRADFVLIADGGYLGHAPGALRSALQTFIATSTPAAIGLTPDAAAACPAREAAFDALFALWTGSDGIAADQLGCDRKGRRQTSDNVR